MINNELCWAHLNINTLWPRQNGRHFIDDIFKCIFLKENAWIPIKNSLKFVPKGPIYNILTLVQIIVWRRSGDEPLSDSMLISLPTHICVTRPQWVKTAFLGIVRCRLWDHLVFIMGILVPLKWHLYIEMPRGLCLVDAFTNNFG